jgi:Ca2+-binding EF-hand superfamily protein
MGNAESADGSVLKTAAIAKHRMQIEKGQVESMVKALRPLASFRRGSIKGHCLQYAMEKAQVSEEPDGEIIELLFTLWDENGTGRVKCNDFMVGISVLACKDDDFLGAIKFALQIADSQNSGMISSKNANMFLLSKLQFFKIKKCGWWHSVVADF